jgi:hypothetical protein
MMKGEDRKNIFLEGKYEEDGLGHAESTATDPKTRSNSHEARSASK